MLFSETRLEGDHSFDDKMWILRCVISLGTASLELFTASMTHIFSSTACIFLLIYMSPEISAGVNEVTEMSLQDEIRKPKAWMVGKVFTGFGTVFVHFFSFSSEGNERWICWNPLVQRTNRASCQSRVCQTAQPRPRYLSTGSSCGFFPTLWMSWKQFVNRKADINCQDCSNKEGHWHRFW